jgi:putative exosortase-associated protein (TIGR04073 family)
MNKSTLSALLISILIATSTVAKAETNHLEGEYQKEDVSYASKIGYKALNGVANLATAVLEIPKSIINTTNESNIVYGVVGGVLKGVINTAGRVATGVTDIVTFPIPTKPIAQPAYIWGDFDVDTSYDDVFRLH